MIHPNMIRALLLKNYMSKCLHLKNMTEKRKDMFERTVENLKKLDKESLAIVKASIEILAARQQMDENTPTNAA